MFGDSPIELMAANAMLSGKIYCESFTYSSTWLTGTASALGANGTVDQQIQINSDSDFVMQELCGVSYSAADTPIVAPDYTLNIVMAGSGRQIFDRPQDWVTTVGNYSVNRVPGSMPFPRILQANNTITNTLTNRTGTAANRVLLAFRGFKIFYLGTDRQSVFHVL
jgi:hypothetical protein